MLLKAIDLNMFNATFDLLGLPSKIFTIELVKNERKHIDFRDFGIPEGSRIVFLNYTPSGGLFPVQLHGNEPREALPQNEVVLYGVPSPDFAGDKVDVNVYVKWSDHNDVVIKYLIDGIHQFNSEQYEEMVIPLNIAVETSISNMVYQHVKSTWTEDTRG